MVVKLNRPDIRYEVESLIRMLLGETPVTIVLPGEAIPDDNDSIAITVQEQEKCCLCHVVACLNGEKREASSPSTVDRTEIEQTICRMLYNQLTALLGHTLPWGMLTGVRPVKLVRQMTEVGMTEADVMQKLSDYGVSEERAQLSMDTWHNQREIVEALSSDQISLYVAIPFCPSRCSYCSFVSHSVNSAAARLDEYLGRMMEEMRQLSTISRHLGLVPDTIYFGGGTPTVLSAEQLKMLFSELECFDLSHIREFTVEAGRPDSITYEKLCVLKAHHVDRISINPQTMNQQTLDLIGRRHTVEQIEEAFALAGKAGLDNINMDMILGLPGENKEMVQHTLEKIKALAPESLTVHSLAIKRAAALNIWREKYLYLQMDNSDEIVSMAADYAHQMGHQPYYMYRQKNMAGNFENVGYSKPGLECIYNILIMEEKQTIIAMGAGASTKIVFQNETEGEQAGRIERIENVKDVTNYIQRIDEMIERKRKFFSENNF